MAARIMRSRRVPLRDLLEAIFLLPLVLPAVVTGYVLLVLLGRNGWVGQWLDKTFDLRLLFTPWAAVLASATVAFPLVYQSAKAAFLAVDPFLEDVAHSLGAKSNRVFWTITVPLAWPGLVAAAVLSFARALGEFGATIMVAGNIPGETVTAPSAIYLAATGSDLHLAGIYAAIMAAFNLVFVLGLNIYTRRRQQRGLVR